MNQDYCGLILNWTACWLQSISCAFLQKKCWCLLLSTAAGWIKTVNILILICCFAHWMKKLYHTTLLWNASVYLWMSEHFSASSWIKRSHQVTSCCRGVTVNSVQACLIQTHVNFWWKGISSWHLQVVPAILFKIVRVNRFCFSKKRHWKCSVLLFLS